MATMTLSAAMAEIKANHGKTYVYILRRPCGAPFYVGVGSTDRLASHVRYARRNPVSGYKSSIIRGILRAGGEVQYEIVNYFARWSEAAAEECRLIRSLGRHDQGLGPLTNRTDGGEGLIGFTKTAEHRQKLSCAHKGKVVSAATREKLRLANLGKKHSAETKAKRAKHLFGRAVSDETKARQRAAMMRWAEENPRPPKLPKQKLPRIYRKFGPRSAEVREKIASSNRGLKRSSEARQNISIAQRKRFERHRAEGGLKLPNHKNSTDEGRAKYRRPVEVDGIRFDGVDLAVRFLGICETTLRRWLKSGHRGARKI